MSTKKKNPQWWQLYVMMPLLVALFWPEMHAALTETEHVIAELGILVLIFGLTHVWLRANRSALARSDPTEYGWGVKVYRYPAPELDAREDNMDTANRRPAPGTPTPNTKGVLEDTFEWDFPEEHESVFARPRNVARER